MEKILIFILSLIVIVSSQDRNLNYEKPGSCPPPVPLQICSTTCFADIHCAGIGKCCATSCGGYICTRPVTVVRPTQQSNEKKGTCPSKPTGRWVCSSTCTSDSQCRGTAKCCKNRCGALACQKPEIEMKPAIEVPADLIPNDIPHRTDDVDISHVNPNNPFLFNNN